MLIPNNRSRWLKQVLIEISSFDLRIESCGKLGFPANRGGPLWFGILGNSAVDVPERYLKVEAQTSIFSCLSLVFKEL
jgi:hypothetical protein